jgi:glutamyl/glutaminyl-tRNA synthetase
MLSEPIPARSLPEAAYRGRLAPSSTGLLHLGNVRTFAIAAARARAAGGTLLLRIEDLDLQRSRPPYVQAIIEDLRWLGLDWAEGPDLVPEGPHAPYTQSACRELYLAAWRSLVERGLAYPCRCSRRQLAAGLQQAMQNEDAGADDEPLYPGTCRPLSAEPTSAAPSSPAGVNWRFRVPTGERVCFDDAVSGHHCYVAGQDFGDFVIWRRDDEPAYQLAVTVDDAAMRITEVVRGADLLKSTARQLLLYRALDLKPPAWFHCPLVVDANGRRLGKRSGALSIRSLREAGHSALEVLSMAGVEPLS